MAKKFTVRVWTGNVSDAVVAERFATCQEADKRAAVLRNSFKFCTVGHDDLGLLGDFSKK